jgi:NTE family protein
MLFDWHYDGLFKSSVLVNLTRKKNFKKWYCIDVILGDNFRFNFDYIENGYNLSFDLSRSTISLIEM